MPQLVMDSEPVRVIPLKAADTVHVGRGRENQLVLRGPAVSRQHCVFEALHSGGHRLVDLGSCNGTYLNGQLVSAMALDPYDQIIVGHQRMVYVDDETSSEAALAQPGALLPWAALGGLWPLSELDVGQEEEQTHRITARLRLMSRSGPPREEDRDLLRQEILLRVGLLSQRMFGTRLDLARLMGTILDELIDFADCERGLLMIHDPDTGEVHPVLGRDASSYPLPCSEWTFSRPLLREALAAGKPMHHVGCAEGGGPERSFLYVPLLTPTRLNGAAERRHSHSINSVFGAFCLQRPLERPLELDEQDTWLIEAIAGQAAVSLQRSRLQHQATTDSLTGLYNRSLLLQALVSEVRRAGPLSLIMLDLDHFKRINDSHGHLVGDEVLRRVAQRIHRSLRKEDMVSRWGGEEFMVLLPGEGVEGGITVAKKIANAVSERPIGEARISVTASLGIAAMPEHGRSVEDLLLRADQAMYAAKSAGRNQTRVYPGTVPLG